MKRYVVALMNFYDNAISQFKIDADNEYEAISKALIEFTSEEYRQSAVDFYNSEHYPKNLEELNDYLCNGDMDASVVEI